MKRLVSLLVLFWIAMISLVQAGDFKVILGEQVDVCEACKRNLERMTVHPACERDYSGQLGLDSPAWAPFDVSGHLDTMEQVLRFLATGKESAEDLYLMDERQFEDAVRRISTRQEPWAYWAQVDINNDGKLEPVLKLHSALCHSRNDGSLGRAYSAPIVVLTENLSGIDRVLTDLVLQNPRRDGRVAGETNYQLYGVFSYKGKTYFDRWNDTGSGDDGERFTLSIYESTGDRTRKLCQLKELQAKRWFPGLPCASRHCSSARPLPARFTP
jgi:hypothetical protein